MPLAAVTANLLNNWGQTDLAGSEWGRSYPLGRRRRYPPQQKPVQPDPWFEVQVDIATQNIRRKRKRARMITELIVIDEL